MRMRTHANELNAARLVALLAAVVSLVVLIHAVFSGSGPMRVVLAAAGFSIFAVLAGSVFLRGRR